MSIGLSLILNGTFIKVLAMFMAIKAACKGLQAAFIHGCMFRMNKNLGTCVNNHIDKRLERTICHLISPKSLGSAKQKKSSPISNTAVCTNGNLTKV